MSRLLRSILAATFGLALAFLATNLRAQEALRDGTRDPVADNLTLSAFVRGAAGDRQTATFFYRRPGAHYLRVSIALIDLEAGDTLEIRGSEDDRAPLVVAGPLREVTTELTSLFIAGDAATVTVTSDDLARSALTIGSIHYQDRALSPWKSIFGKNDMVGINALEPDSPISAIGRSIVFISFMEEGEMRVCSGFLLSSSRVLTNHHCIGDATLCATAQIVFDYTRTTHGHVTMGETRRCAAVVAADKGLDYALVDLDRPADPAITPLRLASRDGAIGAPAALVQHPGGDYKQVSEVGCQIIASGVPGSGGDGSGTDFTHRCDTINGSSGSPIVSRRDARCVIGLHHWGFVSGGLYETVNRAVRAPLIAASLTGKGVDFGTCPSP